MTYIYFVQAGDEGQIKIGASQDPGRRLRELQTGSPVRLHLLAATQGEEGAEKKLHHRFQEFRRDGEWFDPDPEILFYISGLGSNALEVTTCPVCGMMYLPNSPEDNLAHAESHKAILKGALPYEIRELLKRCGWPMARREHRRLGDPIVGKRAVALAWWARARQAGLPDEAFEDYVQNRLDYIDALLDGDEGEREKLDAARKEKWGPYG